MQRKRVVCDSLLFCYQKRKWVHKVLESLRPYLVITESAAGDLTDPGSFLGKINPCFCVWTHAVVLLRTYPRPSVSRNDSASCGASWPQRQLFCAKTWCWDPCPDHAQGISRPATGLNLAASAPTHLLPFSPQWCCMELSTRASLLRQPRNPKDWLPPHHTDMLFGILVLQINYLYKINAVQQ